MFFGQNFCCGNGGKGEKILKMSIDPSNEDFSVAERKKFVFNGRTIFEWEQSLEDVTLYILPPKGITAKQIECEFKKQHLKLGIKGIKPFINENLAYKIDHEESTWYMEKINDPKQKKDKENEKGKGKGKGKEKEIPQNELVIVLSKLNLGETWLSVLGERQQKLNQIEAQKMKKTLMIERFQREHPGFDFSNAKFDGACPDPDKFLNGINQDNLN